MEILARVQKIFQKKLVAPIVKLFPSWVTPNLLTILRGILIIPISLLVLNGNLWSAIFVYLFAALLDGFDGELSRMRAKKTKLGRLLDPLVDRLLHFAVFLLFFWHAPVLFSILFILEIIILIFGGLVLVKTGDSSKLPAPNIAGKWKFVFWALSFLCLLLFEIYLSYFWYLLFIVFIILSIIFSVSSVILFFVRKK